MTMTEERELLVGQKEVLVRIRFSKDVVVLMADRSMNKLRFVGYIEWANRKIREVVSIGIRQHRARPVNGPAGMRIELRGFIQSSCDAIVISANRDCIQ